MLPPESIPSGMVTRLITTINRNRALMESSYAMGKEILTEMAACFAAV